MSSFKLTPHHVPAGIFECPRCYQRYTPSKRYQIFCSEKCESAFNSKMQEIQEQILNKECRQCGVTFRKTDSSSGQVYCDACANTKHQKKLEEKRQKNIYGPGRNKNLDGHRMPLDELIKRQEKERLYKDSGWRHYIKGRKWDKI